MIPNELKTQLQTRIAHSVTKREAAVDVLKMLQAHYGWLTDEAVAEASELLGLTPLQLDELATFYEMLYRRPVGERVIHVCDSISCWAMNGDSLMAHLAHSLGIQPGETTSDGIFTLLPCCCLGNCGEAPAMMIGDVIHDRVTPERAMEIIENERKAAGGTAPVQA
jgi:NADH-quinone oxidoreductase subunit E